MAEDSTTLTAAPLADAGDLPGLSLRANFAWTFAGNVVYTAAQWGMLTVLAKLGNAEMVGRFALGLALSAPVLMLTNLNLRAVQASDAREQHPLGDYLALRLVGTAVALLVLAGLALGYSGETALVILLVGGAKCCEALSDVLYGLLQQQERMDRIALSMMIKGVLSLGGLALAVGLTGSLVWGCAALALAWGLLLVVYDLRNARALLRFLAAARPERAAAYVLRPRWDRWALGALAWLSLPLGLTMMLISLNTNVPRYFVEHYRGAGELGIFAALAYLLVAGWTVAAALGQAATPRLAGYYARGERGAFLSLVGKLLGLGLLLGAAGMAIAALWGGPLLTALYRPEYGAQAAAFTRLAQAAALGYLASFLGYAMTAARYFAIQLPLFALVTAVTAGAGWLLIPEGGLLGAANVLLVGALVQLGTSAGVVAWAAGHCRTPVG